MQGDAPLETIHAGPTFDVASRDWCRKIYDLIAARIIRLDKRDEMASRRCDAASDPVRVARLLISMSTSQRDPCHSARILVVVRVLM